MSLHASLLREARRRAGLSQAALARAAGTSQPAVARIESGTVAPSLETLDRLLRAAGFTLELRLAPLVPADALVEAYKRDVDRTLIRENLRRSVDQRLAMLADAVALGRELDAARRSRAVPKGRIGGAR